jgi:hypothetical protein
MMVNVFPLHQYATQKMECMSLLMVNVFHATYLAPLVPALLTPTVSLALETML